MQMWTEIRRKVLVERVSKRSVCSEYGIGWRTLEKILANSEPPGYRKSAPRAKTKLGPFLGVIEERACRAAFPAGPWPKCELCPLYDPGWAMESFAPPPFYSGDLPEL